MRRRTSPLRRVAAGLAVLAIPVMLVVATAGPAAAHTTAAAAAGPAGSTVITYSFSHGCSGRPTIGLRAKLPAGAWNVTPTDPTGWSSTVSGTEVHWTGPAIADGTAASFVVGMVLTEPAGATVLLPVVQECTDNSENAWIDTTANGDGSESNHPAPKIVVPANSTQPPTTATTATTVTTTGGPTSTARMAANSNAVTEDGSPTNAAGLWVFAGVCAVIVGGAGILYLRHRRAG